MAFHCFVQISVCLSKSKIIKINKDENIPNLFNFDTTKYEIDALNQGNTALAAFIAFFSPI